MFLHLDCRHYLGDRPCAFQRACEGCPHYEPMGPRVLIIKLGALGDVVRTAAILPSLSQLTIDAPYVTWLTAPAAVDLVKRMPGVHRVLSYTEESLLRLRHEKFDLVLSLDKEPGPCAVAMSVQSDRKLGMGLSRYGTVYPLNDEAEYYFALGLDNEEKFRVNQKSMPELLHDALGLTYAREPYRLEPTEADRAAADLKFSAWQGTSNGSPAAAVSWIGLNPGAGGVFANKAWPEASYAALVREIAAAQPSARFLLLGGRSEGPLLDRMMLAMPGLPVYNGGADNSLGAFLGLIDRCGVLVCGDTLAMHLAIARNRPVVALFGPTCEQEIDLFDRGTKLRSTIPCSPCYLRACDKNPTCQDLIAVGEVRRAVLENLQSV